MDGATIVLILIGILVLAVGLVALGLGLARRDRTRGGSDIAVLEPPPAAPAPPADVEAPPADVEAPAVVARPRLRDRLAKTRAAIAGSLGSLTGRTTVDDETWDDLEEALLLADIGVATTSRLLGALREQATATRVAEPEALVELLKAVMVAELDGDRDRALAAAADPPTVWLFVGVNGVGKTTAIAKVARREQEEGRTVLLAAADTFRAAAAEQLGEWGRRVGADLVRGQEGADPGSVVFDAMSAATSRGVDVLLVDTAGRLHTDTNLMEELAKLRRIIDRTPGALAEVLLVIDASTGQNGLVQARQFAESVDVTGVVLTKLDGTAKGGVVLAIESELGIPVKLVGVGETPADLVAFDPVEFVDALFA